MLVYASNSGAAGNKVDLSSPQGYVQQASLAELTAALLTPGPANTELRSVPNGLGLVAVEWRSDTGDRGIYLDDYLLDPRTGGNVADAIELALTENPDASALILPGGELELDRTVDNFTGAGGLRSDLAFVGVPGSTKFVQVGSFTPFFAFPTSTENVSWTGVAFEVDTPVAFSIAIQAYMPRNWIVDKCSFMCTVASNFNGANAALALLGATNCRVSNCYFLRSQCGFGGLGYGCRNVIFSGNVGENVDDFLVSAVCGTPVGPGSHLDIEDVAIVNNVVRGILGAGAIFVGSDGNDSADRVQGVLIANNTFVGTMEGVAGAGARAYILVVAGVTARGISVVNNVIADDANSAISQVGIQLSSLPGTTVFEDSIVALNNIGSLGSNGVQGINIDTRFIDGLQVVDNVCRDNRGIRIVNCRSKTLVQGNRVTAATASALQIEATLANITGLVLKDNDLNTNTLFQNALRLTTAAFTAAMSVENCFLDATAGETFSYTPGAGSAAVDWLDNTWTTGIGATALAAIRNKRPAFNATGGNNWSGAAPLVLTVLPVGHRAGLYSLAQDVIVRTAATSSSTLNRAVSYSAPTIGAVTIAAASMGQDVATVGHRGTISGGTQPVTIESDGSAAVTMTFSVTAIVGGPPVIDVYASATLVGIIPP